MLSVTFAIVQRERLTAEPSLKPCHPFLSNTVVENENCYAVLTVLGLDSAGSEVQRNYTEDSWGVRGVNGKNREWGKFSVNINYNF